ncbi:MAG: GTP-binding protein [Algicola sp.]|nr:GTP-binding protein [Algicola sp.]
MSNINDLVLRPRFKKTLPKPNTVVLETFEELKTTQKAFIVTRIDDHIFIKLPKSEQHFWTPQLHLEVNAITASKSMLHGLFGPNPTVWTMFMFLHFIVACLFMGFGIWAYTNWNLNQGFAIQLLVMFLMVVLWFLLYFIGRMGRQRGKPDMYRLYHFMEKTLNLS